MNRKEYKLEDAQNGVKSLVTVVYTDSGRVKDVIVRRRPTEREKARLDGLEPFPDRLLDE